jgi:ATP-dependent helicase/DNAse subunit B
MRSASSRLFLAPFGFPETTKLLLGEAVKPIQPGDTTPSSVPFDYSSITYIAPTPRKVRAAQLDFMTLTGAEACIPPVFATLGQYVRESYARNGTRRRLSGELKTLLLMRLMREQRPGYAEAVADFISLVRQYRPDLGPDALRKEIRQLLAGFDLPRERVMQAIRVMERYLATLEETSWIDDEGIYAAVARHTVGSMQHTVCRDRTESSPLHATCCLLHATLILDGFYDLTRLEEQVLAKLLGAAESVIALSYDDRGFAGEYELVQGFRSFLHKSVPDLQETRLKPERPMRTAPGFVRYHSREDEVTGIAHDLKLKLKQNQLKSNQAIVVFPSFVPYAPIVKRVFDQHGLPYTVYPDQCLATSPPIVAVMQLLEAIQNDHPRIPFVTVLTSPYFSRVSPTCRSSVNRLSLMAGIIKGAKNWGHIERWLLASEKVEAGTPEAETLARTQQEVNLVLSFCREFSAKGRNTLTGYAHDLKALLAKLDFGAAIAPDSEQGNEYLLHRRRFYQLLDTIMAFEAAFGTRRYLLAEFCRLVAHLTGSIASPPERELTGVLVCSTLETRGLDCEQLYYGGLIEGELPSRFKHDPILPDWVREKLNLPHLDRHNQWQRLHFFRLVNTPRRAPFLSYPDTESDRLLLPSPFLEGPQNEPEPAAYLFSPQEHQRWLGAEEHRKKSEVRGQRSEPDVLTSVISTLTSPCPLFGPVLDLGPEPEIRAELLRRFGPDQPLSVTRLERYRRCPFIFYVENVLGLEIAEEPSFELEPRQWGIIFHTILERLYQKGDVPLDQMAERVRQILPRVMAQAALPYFWRLAIERIFDDLLSGFLRCETRMREQGFHPVRVERTVNSRIFPDLLLKGRVDRIDRGPDSLRIIDYKTGSTNITAGEIVNRRSHIQLPLYAQMVSERYPDTPVTDIGIFDLREMKVSWLAEARPLDELIQAARDNTRDIVDQIRAGRFPSQPANAGTCDRCAYQFLCPGQSEFRSSGVQEFNPPNSRTPQLPDSPTPLLSEGRG